MFNGLIKNNTVREWHVIGYMGQLNPCPQEVPALPEWTFLAEKLNESFSQKRISYLTIPSATEPSPAMLKAEHQCVLLLWPAVSGWKAKYLAVQSSWAPRQSMAKVLLPSLKKREDKQINPNVMVSMCSKYFLVLELNPFCENMSKYIN